MSSETTAVAKSEAPKPLIKAGNRGLVLETLDDYWRFATCVVKSKLAPRSFTTPEAILIALQSGAEIGLSPMQSLSAIAVVNGKPCLWGDGLKAVVENSPHCEWIKETISGEGENMVATCEAKRVGRPEPTVRCFSWQDAKRAGLVGKGTWQSYPQRMLQMRARGFALRDQFADVLCGLGVAEEQQDAEQSRELTSGTVAPASDLDQLAESFGETVEAGEIQQIEQTDSVPEGQLFDVDPVNEGVGQ